MKRDIRTLFNTETPEAPKAPPANHRQEFIKKLDAQQIHKSSQYYWPKIAATIMITLAVALTVYYTADEEKDVSPFIAEIEAVETQYLERIELEWENFVAVAQDSVLVARFRKKLDELDANYTAISTQFEEDSNNVLIVEALVNNLQTRLQILKDIQAHIEILNQNDEHYENKL